MKNTYWRINTCMEVFATSVLKSVSEDIDTNGCLV